MTPIGLIPVQAILAGASPDRTYVECIADDVKPGEVTSFPQAVKLQDDEIVVFSWIVYESREHRDRVMEAVMSDPRIKMDPTTMPFDGKRMFWGGFRVLLAM